MTADHRPQTASSRKKQPSARRPDVRKGPVGVNEVGTTGTGPGGRRSAVGGRVILVLYVALAVGYNLATPFGAPPDERPHSVYVEHLATRGSLPVLLRGAREAYEAHQPPLYYFICLPVWWASRALPAGDPAGAWPRDKTLRLVSTMIGAAGLLLIARLARIVSPEEETLALGATAFAAFLPMRLATAAAVGNDLLAELIFTATLLLLVAAVRGGITARRTLALGVALGLGLLTKSTCLLLFPIAALGLALAASKRAHADGKQRATTVAFLGSVAGSFVVALVIGGWWLVRNQQLYGEVFVARTFERYFQDTARPEFFLRQGMTFAEYMLFLVIPLTFRSFWGVFGHMQISMGALTPAPFMPPSWIYPLLALPTIASVGGLARVYARRQAMEAATRAVWGLLVVTWLLVAAAFLRFNTAFFQAQGRYLFPAMAPIALLFTLGLQSVGPTRWAGRVALGTAGAMLLLALYALFGCIVPAFG
jgi:4-amino-4-deoxy-L-arabinose transferase-like glycosyltransferase